MGTKKILIATTNKAKFQELRHFLTGLPFEFVSLSDCGIQTDVAETGVTFQENAILKARSYARESYLPAIADDGGLEIDALHGEPGVKSHRWITGDHENTDDELIAYTMQRMKHIPKEKRGAQLRLVLAIALPDGEVETSEAAIRGVIAESPSRVRTQGFPYRSLLYLPDIGKFYDNSVLSPDELRTLNHRKKAVDALIPHMMRLLTR